MPYIKPKTYEEYTTVQIAQSKRKHGAIWVRDEDIDKIVDYVKRINLNIKFGICHGARNGYEVEKFRTRLGTNSIDANIIGTDISDNADKIPHMITHDFHEAKPEWIRNTDFIYTNSFDHCYDFNKALDSWMSCLTENGRCFLDWSPENTKPFNICDCFGATLEELVSIVSEKYDVEDILKSGDRRILVIKKRKQTE